MRLEVTRRTDLATRALVEMYNQKRRIKSAELAAAIGTTAGFLSQALTPMADHQWVRSVPGPTGGYELTTDISTLSVLDVIEAIEGPTDGGKCVVADRLCNSAEHCLLHHSWGEARQNLLTTFRGVSILDAATRVDAQ